MMYAGDNDDFFPRNDYQTVDRLSWAAITYREAEGPYIKNGITQVTWVMNGKGASTGPIATSGIWQSPDQPQNSRYGYGTNQALFPSSQLWSSHASGAGAPYADQNPDGTPTGISPVPSVSQNMLASAAGTLLLTTIGIDPAWNSANLYMQSTNWWWQGGTRSIHGATIPPEWDADQSNQAYDGTDPGPTASLPRFRYLQGLNVAWADGHVKFKKKGGLSWCTDMFVPGSIVDPWNPDHRDDADAFNPAGACAGMGQS